MIRGLNMDDIRREAAASKRLANFTAGGIVIGSIAGLVAGMFWFEMGLSLLFGTAIGLILGVVIGSVPNARS